MDTRQFGKNLPSIIFLLALIELLSLVTFIFKPLHNVAFVVVVVFIIRLLARQPQYALPVVLTELAIGGKGYLFWLSVDGFSISIRMAIYVIVLVHWFLPFLLRPSRLKELRSIIAKPIAIVFGLLMAVVLLQLWHGVSVNQFSNALLDFNAWAFFGLIVVFLVHIQRYDVNVVYETVCGAVAYLSIKSIIALYLFSHGLTGVGGVFYSWIRDTGVGEITHVSGPLFRIFFQSQLYAIFGSILALALLLFRAPLTAKQHAGLWIFFYASTLSIVISQSRSFWVGLAVGIVSILAYGYVKGKSKPAVIGLAAATMLILGSHLFTIGVISGNYEGNVLAKRFNNLPGEPASATRLNQLKPLQQAITQSPFIGYGFGKTLTYTSDDPRVRSQRPDGQFTTYAFEWGYYDLWLKFGAVGLTVYLAYIANVAFALGYDALVRRDALPIGLFGGLIAMLAVHNFSPYLNHPLGIGFLLFVTALALKPKSLLSQAP